jgi:hypothetical protein
MKYKDILSDTLNDLVDLHKFSNAMYMASKDQWILDMRRASTFNLLHEAAVIKETDLEDAPRPMSTMSGKTTPATVILQARRELNNLRAQPPSSHKWTWGSTLSVEDVLSLSSVTTRSTSPQIDTSTHSLPTSYGRYDDVPFPVTQPVENADHTQIPYFDHSNRLVYDPLNIAAPESRLIAQTTSRSAPIAGPSSMARSCSPDGLANLAHEWVPESDEEQQPSSPGHLNLAGTWIQGSEEEEPVIAEHLPMQKTTAPESRLIAPTTSRSAPIAGPSSMARSCSPDGLANLAHEWVPESDEEQQPSSPDHLNLAGTWIQGSEEEEPVMGEHLPMQKTPAPSTIIGPVSTKNHICR